MTSPFFPTDAPLPIRCVLIEDDRAVRLGVKTTLRLYFPQTTLLGECVCAEEVETLLGAAEADILLLDINLPGGTAFEVLAKLGKRDFEIIVLSAQADFRFAQEAIRFGALAYLTKPFEREEFCAAMEQAIEKVIAKRSKTLAPQAPVPQQAPSMPASAARLVVKTSDNQVRAFDYDRIARLESNGRLTLVCLADGATFEVRKPLDEIARQLPTSDFYRTHRSHCVNLRHVVRARDYFVFFSNGDRAEVSVRGWKRFREALAARFGGE